MTNRDKRSYTDGDVERKMEDGVPAVTTEEELITEQGVVYAFGSNGNYAEPFSISDYSDIGEAVKAANDVLTSVGGMIVLPAGSYNWTTPVALDRGVWLKGMGKEATRINIDAAITDNAITAVDYCGVEKLHINMDNNVGYSPLVGGVDTSTEGFSFKDIRMTGGADESIFAITVRNAFHFSLENIVCKDIGTNGVEIGTDNDTFNYGNSNISNIEVQTGANNAVNAFYIHGDVSDSNDTGRNYNLLNFNYITAGSSANPGVGIKIENASWMQFNVPDVEGFDTSLSIDGAVNGGASSELIQFNTPYFSNDVNIGSDVIRPTFVGGAIYGQVSQEPSGTPDRVAKFYGTEGTGGVPVNHSRAVESTTVTGDGATTDWDLNFTNPLGLSPRFWDASLNNEGDYPNYNVRYATADKVHIRFESAPADGTTLEFGYYAEV